jgi:hypothetical protein
MSLATKGRLRSIAWLVAVVIAYAILAAVFSSLSEHRGLITPNGAVDKGFVALGLVVLVTRIGVLFVVPFIAVYRAATWASEVLASRQSIPRRTQLK